MLTGPISCLTSVEDEARKEGAIDIEIIDLLLVERGSCDGEFIRTGRRTNKRFSATIVRWTDGHIR